MDVSDLLRALIGMRDPELEMDARELHDRIATASPHIIDIREPHELAETGRLKQAVHIPMREVSTRLRQGEQRDPDRDIVLYCRVGNRSYFTARELRDQGFTRVKSVRGGIGALRSEGFDIVPH